MSEEATISVGAVRRARSRGRCRRRAPRSPCRRGPRAPRRRAVAPAGARRAAAGGLRSRARPRARRDRGRSSLRLLEQRADERLVDGDLQAGQPPGAVGPDAGARAEAGVVGGEDEDPFGYGDAREQLPGQRARVHPSRVRRDDRDGGPRSGRGTGGDERRRLGGEPVRGARIEDAGHGGGPDGRRHAAQGRYSPPAEGGRWLGRESSPRRGEASGQRWSRPRCAAGATRPARPPDC